MTDTSSQYIKKAKKHILRQTGKALLDHQMINDGDRVLLGLSGGKDSLALLHLLIHFQRVAPIKFELATVTIDPQTGTFDPSPLIPYMASLGIEYHYCKEPIMTMAEAHLQGDSYCAFCARMKRGTIYATARKHHYNVIALAQHLDDLAESFLMSAFHGGQLKTMKANYTIKDGDLRLIRPLIYVREQQTRDYAHYENLPVIIENCPACFAKPTQREHMKQLLAAEEKQNNNLFGSLLTAMKPLLSKKSA
ncbi:MAG: tRNA 2-thiocytidine biosynthesis protein TtcA [Aquificaceae bacterium]|nr:MAG: tRNA 2-thiocytidine biosynthesis protein TtcA [Aquificaceae bacterium]